MVGAGPGDPGARVYVVGSVVPPTERLHACFGRGEGREEIIRFRGGFGRAIPRWRASRFPDCHCDPRSRRGRAPFLQPMKSVLPPIPSSLPSGASGRFPSAAHSRSHAGLRRLCVPALALLLTLVGGAAVPTAPAMPAPVDPAVALREPAPAFSDRVILAQPRAAQRATVAADEAREGLRVRRTFPRFGDLRVIELSDGESVPAAIARLQATGRYEFVEPSFIQKPNALPDDPSFPQLWHFNNTGQSAGGVAGTDIKAVAAWDVINDASRVVVAIIDSGARLTHPEIAPNLWRNPNPTFGDLHGARFTSGTGQPTSGDPTDENGHGTRMAGCIGAAGNNGTLIAGVAWKVQMMILRQGDNEGDFFIADTVACIDYAIRHGAQVINCSFGTSAYSQALFNALKAARDAGVIVVCAAGNGGVSTDVAPFYPAGFALDNIVTVAMSRNNDVAAGSFGNNVDLFAPGFGVTALNWANDTGLVTVTGSSPSTAFVTGSFALLKARFPGDTYRQLINRLLRATDRKPAFSGRAQSGGRLNLLNAVTSTTNRPMNDDFSTRAVVAGNIAVLRSNNAGATTESGETTLAGAPAAATLWWEWTAPATAPVTIDTAGSDYDTLLAVYTGTALGGLTAVAGNDDAAGRTTSRVTFNAQAGTTYQFAIGGKGAATGQTLVNLAVDPGVVPPAPFARLANLSVLTSLNTPGETLILGYVVRAAGKADPKPLLIRAAAPTLATAPFNVPGVMADPRIDLFVGQTAAGGNDNWGGTAALNAAFAGVGAFPYAAPTSLDAAVVYTNTGGLTTARITAGGNGTGTVLAEFYDATPIAGMNAISPRLTNVSVRATLRSSLTAGFVIDGTGTKRVLIRAVGPTLANFGVTGVLADPQLTLFSGQTVIGANDNWGGTAELTAASNQVAPGFVLPANSRDAVILATLSPGSYTAEVTGVGGATGNVIVEVYEVP